MHNHPARNTTRRNSVAVTRSIRARFIAPAITAFTVFSLYGFYFSLAPGVLIDSLHLSNRAVAVLTRACPQSVFHSPSESSQTARDGRVAQKVAG